MMREEGREELLLVRQDMYSCVCTYESIYACSQSTYLSRQTAAAAKLFGSYIRAQQSGHGKKVISRLPRID